MTAHLVCDTTCTGHLGKFGDCLTELLHDMSGDGCYRTAGSVEAYGHFTLMVFDVDDTTTSDVVIPAGAYVVEENSQGFVHRHDFESVAEAEAFFADADCEYGEWWDANGEVDGDW